eukprot:GHRR01027243.1.p1 GENE.GHRR01027243.1~~GHRR01027243.1.p1  ORF type:complete len:262 (-),score=79.15 GHRR01027243.1:285-1070(-)
MLLVWLAKPAELLLLGIAGAGCRLLWSILAEPPGLANTPAASDGRRTPAEAPFIASIAAPIAAPPSAAITPATPLPPQPGQLEWPNLVNACLPPNMFAALAGSSGTCMLKPLPAAAAGSSCCGCWCCCKTASYIPTAAEGSALPNTTDQASNSCIPLMSCQTSGSVARHQPRCPLIFQQLIASCLRPSIYLATTASSLSVTWPTRSSPDGPGSCIIAPMGPEKSIVLCLLQKAGPGVAEQLVPQTAGTHYPPIPPSLTACK